MDDRHYLQSIKDRVRRFHRLPGVHLPIYEEPAGIDLGKYLCLVRETEFWTGKYPEELPARNAEVRATISEHLIRSVQDVEELLSRVENLEQENRRLIALTGK
jgi:hypothetical protein